MIKENTKIINQARLMVHGGSLVFLALLMYLVINQQLFIERIFHKHFRLTISNVLTFFSSDEWAVGLVSNVKQMTTSLIILAVIEIIIVVVGLIAVGYLLYRLRKLDQWHLSEKWVAGGYLFLVVSLMIILTKMMIIGFQTVDTVSQRVNSLSVSEIKRLQTELSTIFVRSNLTLENLIPGGLALLEQVKGVIHKTNEIAGIPKLIKGSWEQLLGLKNWLISCSIVGVVSILLGHIMEGIRQLKLYQRISGTLHKSRNSRQIDVNERLVEVVEQQAVLIKLLMESSEAVQKPSGTED